jgi:hypothetical protein
MRATKVRYSIAKWVGYATFFLMGCSTGFLTACSTGFEASRTIPAGLG